MRKSVTAYGVVCLRECLALLVAAAVVSGAPSAKSLYRSARKAAQKGDYRQAFALANQAVAEDPANPDYWALASALRRRGLEGANVAFSPQAPATSPDSAADGLSDITDEDLREARRALPPPVLKGDETTRSFDLRGDSKKLFEQVAGAYGLHVVFDGDYQPVPNVHFRLDRAGYREALRALEAVASSFLIAVNPKVALVARDTAQKRKEMEPVMAVTVPFPDPISVQEVQEGARAVQSTFDLQKMGIDNGRRLVFFRGPVSRLRPAIELFRQLMTYRGQVYLDIDLITVAQNSTLNYGTRFQTNYQLVNFGPNRLDGSGTLPNVPSGLTGNFLTFGGGWTLFGVGVTDTQLFSSMTRGSTKSLTRTSILSLEGQPANFHLGDRYPIVTQQFVGEADPDARNIPPPTINFEDLGVNVKVTPWLHSSDEVTLEFDAEYKLLTGQTLNGIPVITNRKFASRVRLPFGQSAVVAGLDGETLSRGWNGFPLLGAIAPPLRSNTVDSTQSQLLLLITPRLAALPPFETATHPLWVGTETRPLTPLD